MTKQQRDVVEEVLRVPADVEADADAERVADEQKRVGGETCKGLLGLAVAAHDRIGKQPGLVSVVSEVLAQPVCEVPDAHHKQREHDYFSPRRKHGPQLRPHHREEESRKKQRYGRENGALAFAVLESIAFQNLVHQAVPLRLHREISGAFCVRIVGVENRITAVLLRSQVIVVVSTLLRIDQRVIRLRQQGKLASGFGVWIQVGMTFTRKFPVGRFDFGLRGSGLYAQKFVVVDHCAFEDSLKASDECQGCLRTARLENYTTSRKYQTGVGATQMIDFGL